MPRYPAGGYYLLICYLSYAITVRLGTCLKWAVIESLDGSISKQKNVQLSGVPRYPPDV